MQAVAEAEAYHTAGHSEKIEDQDEATRMVDRVTDEHAIDSTNINNNSNSNNTTLKPPPSTKAALPSTLHTKTHISAKEFEDISQLLLLHLKHAEEAYNDRADEDDTVAVTPFAGVQWQALITWYIQQFESHLLPPKESEGTDESKLSEVMLQEQSILYQARRKVLSQIIRRLVKHDGSIVVLEGSSGSGKEKEGSKTPNEEKYLKLHPSMVI